MKTILSVIIALLVLGAGYYWYSNRDSNPEEGAPISVEATLVYEGTIPAASSTSIDVSLTLMDRGDGQGGGFTLVETFVGEEDGTFESTGQWEIRTGLLDEAPEAEVIVLTSEEDPDFQTRYYEMIDEDTIRVLANGPERIDSELPYELELQ